MEFFLRIFQLIAKIVYTIVLPVIHIIYIKKRKCQTVAAPIENIILTFSLMKALEQMKRRELTSLKLVEAYIARIKAVNPFINAVVEDRFEDAIEEAEYIDELIYKTNENDLDKLFSKYPLLGIPYTLKESCGLKGLSHIVGSSERINKKCIEESEIAKKLDASGAIPLLVSANPEYCFSIETNTYTNGKCNNPYDYQRTSGGSSGGEGALNGVGASVFGIGSDIAGSIRIPCLFNGVFGHKPTGGIVSAKGHFPYSTDKNFHNYLQIGPITRFACDLKIIMHVLAGDNAASLNLFTYIDTRSIKIYYSLGFSGINGILHYAVNADIKQTILRAVNFFQEIGMTPQLVDIKNFKNSTEIALSGIARLSNFPYLINSSTPFKVLEALVEYVKSLIGKSKYTRDGLLFELMRRCNAFMPHHNLFKYIDEASLLKAEIISLLRTDGILIFPTFPVPAIHHCTSHLPIWSIDYTLIFNIIGLPCTHIPMGLNSSGLPIGFQVIAAPYRDNLCFKIAETLEKAFGGWQAPQR